MPVPCTHKAGNHRSQVRPMGTQVPYRPGMESGPVMGAYLPVMLSSSNTILTALIQGRSPGKISAAPSSLLEVFHNPWRFREHSLTGFLSEVAGQLTATVEAHLERVPLGEEGKGLLASKLLNLNRESNKEKMRSASISYGISFLNELGYEFEKREDLGPVREFLVEVISLAEVGRRLCSWLGKKEGEISEDKRAGALAELQVLVNLILEKENDWLKFREEEKVWQVYYHYITADEIKWAYKQGITDFSGTQVLGDKEDRNLREVNLSGAGFRGANLSGANLREVDFSKANLIGAKFSGADLYKADLIGAYIREADLSGANLDKAVINYQALLSLNTGEWAGEKTLVERINAWASRGGKLDFGGADLSDVDLSGANLREALLWGIDLSEADLSEADLSEADFFEANLSRARLIQADLREAELRKVCLFGANLREADLRGADLFKADLRGADLNGANLWKTDLRGVNLSEVKIDSETEWKGAKIDTKALETLSTGPFEGLSIEEKKEVWKDRGGIIEGEEE